MAGSDALPAEEGGEHRIAHANPTPEEEARALAFLALGAASRGESDAPLSAVLRRFAGEVLALTDRAVPRPETVGTDDVVVPDEQSAEHIVLPIGIMYTARGQLSFGGLAATLKSDEHECLRVLINHAGKGLIAPELRKLQFRDDCKPNSARQLFATAVRGLEEWLTVLLGPIAQRYPELAQIRHGSGRGTTYQLHWDLQFTEVKALPADMVALQPKPANTPPKPPQSPPEEAVAREPTRLSAQIEERIELNAGLRPLAEIAVWIQSLHPGVELDETELQVLANADDGLIPLRGMYSRFAASRIYQAFIARHGLAPIRKPGKV